MKSILELFAQDEIKVNTRHYNHSKEYLDKYKELEELENSILEKLCNEGKELFQKYQDIIIELQDINRTAEFIYGYQLGTLMTIDVYSILDYLSSDDNDWYKLGGNFFHLWKVFPHPFKNTLESITTVGHCPIFPPILKKLDKTFHTKLRFPYYERNESGIFF